jgi:hypothetical protein
MDTLSPPPGEYQLPLMRFARFGSAPNGAPAIMLTFETTSASDPSISMTIAVPISLMDAAGMLDGLKKLQAIGKIPLVAETNRSKN